MRRARTVLTALVLGALAWIAAMPELAAQSTRGSAAPMPMMPGMNVDLPPAATSGRPIVLDRTVLLLIATVMTAGGIAAWSAVRRGSGRGVGAVNEAVLVVDLVESTHLATHYGDALAMRARNTLKDLALATAERHGVTFVENTGDGWFMTFPSVAGAIEAAKDVLRDLRRRPPDLSPAPALEARAAITYGEILLDARGTRHGAVINKAFRLVGLSAANVAPVDGATETPTLPDRNRILVDEEAAQELRATETRRFVGYCHLKGFSGLHGVYVIAWDEQA